MATEPQPGSRKESRESRVYVFQSEEFFAINFLAKKITHDLQESDLLCKFTTYNSLGWRCVCRSYFCFTLSQMLGMLVLASFTLSPAHPLLSVSVQNK